MMKMAQLYNYSKYSNMNRLKKQRNNVAQHCPGRLIQLYDHLSTINGAKSWGYLCEITQNIRSSHLPIYIHCEEYEEAKLLRDAGISSFFFSYPHLALKKAEDLVMARFILLDKLIFVYDIIDNKIILGTVPERLRPW